MPAHLVDGDDRLRGMSPETLKITAVCINPDIQGSITCNFSVNGANFGAVVFQNKISRQPLRFPVVIRRGMSVVIRCVYNKQMWNKPAIITRDIPFNEILHQVLSNHTKTSTPTDGLELILHIDLGEPPHVLEYLFRLKPVDTGPVVQISMAKVNQAITGRGFHYIGLLADGSTMFQRRLTRAPYPQEFRLDPMFSFHPEMDLRLCLFRRPFYVWPTKSVIKFSALTASEAHDLLYAGTPGPDGVDHTLEGMPEITVRLHLQNSTGVLDRSAHVISRRTRLLDRLGRSRGLIENVFKFCNSASELHDIAKTVAQALGLIYNVRDVISGGSLELTIARSRRPSPKLRNGMPNCLTSLKT
ncbi:hypothetical protein B0H19DRAFT_660044 [Mycena capillaripes]|nr:hypothetical protein B0H19DRAFT_660044 [Mycena capillaripes]